MLPWIHHRQRSENVPEPVPCSALVPPSVRSSIQCQMVAYFALLANIMIFEGPDAKPGVFVDISASENPHESSGSIVSENECTVLELCNLQGTMIKPETKHYSISCVAIAVFLIISISASDLRAAYVLLLWGDNTVQRVFGLSLFAASTLLFFASMAVLFDSAENNTDLVLGAATVLFIAEAVSTFTI